MPFSWQNVGLIRASQLLGGVPQHHGDQYAADQEEKKVQEASAAFYRTVHCYVDRPLNRLAFGVRTVNVHMRINSTSINHVDGYRAAQLMDGGLAVAVGGKVFGANRSDEPRCTFFVCDDKGRW